MKQTEFYIANTACLPHLFLLKLMTGADLTEELTIIAEMFKRQQQKAEKKASGINSPRTVK